MEALYMLDLREKNEENWQDYHKEDNDIWDSRIEFLPIPGPFISLDRKARSKKLCQERQRRTPQPRRSKQDAVMGSSLTPTEQGPSMSTPHSSQFTLFILIHFTNPMFSSQASHYAPPQHHNSTPFAEARTASHSSIEECDGEDDKEGGEGGDKNNGGDKDEHEGRGENKEDEDNGDVQMKESTPQVVHRNLARTH
ncbi:hypothetical protein Gogos_019364 [Gossypium gossypioides]|uniref:Uncharacterized protein n=1 Tax=Gossypium gossypioides TaxID=34282 RepID=A0A7J9BH57_GOSGO|nr:hypothetical protein [Gossypium gossypioides]